MNNSYRITVSDAIKLDCIGGKNSGLKKNDWCIIKCNKYEDYGRVAHIGEIPRDVDSRSLPVVKRRATLVDQSKAHENSVRSNSFKRTALEKIKAHKMPMKLIETHYVFDRSLVIFTFTAPERLDFRELVKELNTSLSLRVEFKQMGPRDYAGLVGGLETCGRTLCCSTFLTNFVSINMKMAKDQGLSLSPSNIIGACGRLKCCLSYEHEGYKSLIKSMPKVGSSCQCEGCEGKILDGNLLTQTVKVSLDNGTRVVTVPVSEVS
jgi:cell fate regulator YaaT (PSP1 superfamily)